jgi:tRNA(adenine34) deaminase
MNPDPDTDARRMREALRLAAGAAEAGEVPVGCVIYAGAERVAAAHNQREALQDPTAHAEMIAITQAAGALGGWRLGGCCLYVTLEPCAMCAGAIVLARMDRVVFGAPDPKAGACGSVLDILADRRLNHQPAVTGGVLAGECGAPLAEFFQARRGGNG